MIRLRKPMFSGPITLRHPPGGARLSALGQDIEDESEEDDKEHADIKHEAVIGVLQVCAKDEYEDDVCEVSAFMMKETFNDEMLNHSISVYEAAVTEVQTKTKELVKNEPMSLLDLENIQTGKSYKKYQPEDVVVFDRSEWKQKPEEPEEPDEPEEEEEEEEEEGKEEGLGERAPRGRFSDEDRDPRKKKRQEDELKDRIIVGYTKILVNTGDPVSVLQTALTNLHDEIQNLDGEKSVDHANEVLDMVWGEEQSEKISVDRAYLYP